jgi:hypothetical protein
MLYAMYLVRHLLESLPYSLERRFPPQHLQRLEQWRRGVAAGHSHAGRLERLSSLESHCAFTPYFPFLRLISMLRRLIF